MTASQGRSGNRCPTVRGPTDRLPTTTFDQLQNLTYISRSADRCTWRGHDCAFKRIEFDCDIRVLKDEITCRETLLAVMERDGLSGDQDPNIEMTRRFLVVPILAVVSGQTKPWKPGIVAGLLMPFSGHDLEILVREPDATLPITESQLHDLARGVQQLSKCGVQHGDIKYWNTVLQPAMPEETEEKLVLIDLGTVAPEYDGDAKALGTLLLWCLEHAPALRDDEGANARVVAAAAALVKEDFDGALGCFSAGDTRRDRVHLRAFHDGAYGRTVSLSIALQPIAEFVVDRPSRRTC